MILRTRVFSLALLLALAAMTPGVLKAQDAQPMSEVSLGTFPAVVAECVDDSSPVSTSLVSGHQ